MYLDYALVVANSRTRKIVLEDPVSNNNDHALYKKQDYRDYYIDIEIVAEEGFVGWEVALNCINGCQGKGLV